MKSAGFNYVGLTADGAGAGGGFVSITKPVRNARLANYKLRGDGIELLRNIELPFTSYAVDGENNNDDDSKRVALKRRLRQVMLPLAQKLAGADEVYYYPHLMRSERPKTLAEEEEESTTSPDSTRPHDIVHNDYTADFHRYLLQMSREELANYLGLGLDYDKLHAAKRVVVLQFWASAQPPGTVLEHHPLALCVPRSVQRAAAAGGSEHVRYPLPQYAGAELGDFAVYLGNAYHADSHEWVYYPQMTRSEMLVWCGYDSMAAKASGFHSAFDNSEAAKAINAPPRESIEMRVLCLLSDTQASFLVPQSSSL